MTKLFIPTKIRVGFQTRKDTFTGKLAYVIYYDEKGKIRKEVSWNGWRDVSIPYVEFDNAPRNNYVFNKGIKRDGYWGSGRSVIRVYDPRDFEFEISIDNLIGILMHSDVSKRDIVEDCVFAWAGSELVLLPVNSAEYQESVVYTEKQSQSISAKTLVKGYTYSQKKKEENLIYIGYFQWYEWGYISGNNNYYSRVQRDKGNRHVFYDGYNFVIPGVNTLAEVVLAEPSTEYPSLVDKYITCNHYLKIKSIDYNGKPVKVSEPSYPNQQDIYIQGYRKTAIGFDTIRWCINPNNIRNLNLSSYGFSITHYTVTYTTNNELVVNQSRPNYDYSYSYKKPPEYYEFIRYLNDNNLPVTDQVDNLVKACQDLGYINELKYVNEDDTLAPFNM